MEENIKTESPKLRIVAFLLCWILGVFGAHRFYAGRTWSAVAMLVISLTYVGLIVTGIWAIVDVIVIGAGNFKDGEGKLIKKWSN